MKNKLNSMSLVAVAMILSVLAPLSAHADLGELAALLKSPLGRYVMLETATGAEIAARLIGGKVEQLGAEDIDGIISRLSSEEMSSTAEELEARLTRVRDRFQYMAPKVPGEITTKYIDLLLSQEMLMKVGEKGAMEFLPSQSGNSYSLERENFVKGGPDGQAGKMATADLSGQKVDPGSLQLTRHDLRFADMSQLDATHANFSGSMMEGADLTDATLTGGNFREANLTFAKLTGARLKGASFRGANLRGADLRGTNLNGVDMQRADLRGTDLTDAYVGATYFRAGIEGQFKGALYNSKTKLPFTTAEAKKLGMILVAG